MGDSLFALAGRGGGDVARVGHEQGEGLEKIHYPENDARELARMEEAHFWFTSRREAVLSYLRPVTERGGKPRGLDIGCGSGFNAQWLASLGYPMIGIDAYDPVLRDGRAAFVRGDIFKLDPEPEFDFVLLLDVIEHIENDEAFVKQALRFLKPGGVAVLTVPAFEWLWSPNDDHAQHLRRYTKRDLRALASRLPGVRLDRQAYFYGATLPMYFVSRLLHRFSKDAVAREQAPGAMVNGALKLALKAESLLLPLGGLPVGSSLFARLRKD